MQPVFLPSRREITLQIKANEGLAIHTNYESVTPGFDAVFSVTRDPECTQDYDAVTCRPACEVSLFVNVAQVVLRDSRLETSYIVIPTNEFKPVSITKDSIHFNEVVTPGKYLLSMGKSSPRLVTVAETINDIPYEEHLTEAITQSFMDGDLVLQGIKSPFNQVAQFELKEQVNTFSVSSELINKLRVSDGLELQTFTLHVRCKTDTNIKVLYDVVPSDRLVDQSH